MQIGTGIANQIRNIRPELIPEFARRAEEAGFSSLATVGRHAYPGVSDTVALAAAAAVTSRIGLFSGVLLAPTWPAQLLAKELAGIDGIAGGRLTAGFGVGVRPDDFVAEGFGEAGRGARFDRDLETYRAVWAGENVGGAMNPAVTPDARQIPLVFGGFAPAALRRMARWGVGYVAGSVPAAMAAPAFEAARAAWKDGGREGSPRMIGLVYYALGDGEAGRRNVYDYYSVAGDYAKVATSALCDSPQAVREMTTSYGDLGIDELIFNPGTDDPDDIERLADIVL
ncbi:LLM class flavin-dependent oxidoreductase [Nocardia alni]|uniref:LLM class flavin-dependent oxidoreductase n=1 Tax=Nocardia alni TaxID=2815723 RepID=UPI001C24EBB7|nr:LLM class flavin-dependent oxidoreductase [Nocardia alni]